MRLAPLILLVCLAWDASPAPLDDALFLALSQSAVVAGSEAKAKAVNRQHDWEAKVDFERVLMAPEAAATSSRFGSSSGKAGDMKASFTLVIPLFSGKQRQAEAEADAKLRKDREKVGRDLLNGVAELEGLAEVAGAGAEKAAFYRDRLAYFKQAERSGQIEPALLWGHAEKAKLAEQEARQAKVKLDAALRETARRYGGEEWNALLALLAAHLKQSGH